MLAQTKFQYHGYNFNTQLEKAWAIFFDSFKWKWSYDSDKSLFTLQFISPILAKVTPATELWELKTFSEKFNWGEWNGEVLLLGAHLFVYTDSQNLMSLGLLGERFTTDDYWFEEAIMMTCGNCGKESFYHALGSWHCRVNRCYDGDHYLGYIDNATTLKLWRDACRAAGVSDKPQTLGTASPKSQMQQTSSVLQNEANNQAASATNPVLWNGLRFRSKSEVKIAEALDNAKVLYLPNCIARLGTSHRAN